VKQNVLAAQNRRPTANYVNRVLF